MVNAPETKNLPGRKSDVQESQWLMKLHTYGLLRNPFRPSQEIRIMRTYWRQRNESGAVGGAPYPADSESADADEPPVSKCLRDLSGVTGQAIVKAIRAGEQSAEAGCPAGRTRESKRSGDCSQRGELARRSLILTKQEQDGHEFCVRQISECDARLRQYLKQRQDRSAGASLPEEKRRETVAEEKGEQASI